MGLSLGSSTAERSTFQVDVALHPENNNKHQTCVMVGPCGFTWKRAGDLIPPGMVQGTAWNSLKSHLRDKLPSIFSSLLSYSR